jgi:hypothetical protein
MKIEETEKLFSEFFNQKKLQNKFKEIFEIKEDSLEEIYIAFINLFKKLIEDYKALSTIRPNDEEKNLKDINNIYNVFDVLILIIEKNYIKKNESKEIKNKAIEEFTNIINQLPYCLLCNIDKFINILNIEKELNDYVAKFKDFKELSNKYNNISSLYIIKKCNLQNKYNFTNFKINPGKNQEFYYLIEELYNTYNISNKMLNELNDYIKNNVEKNYFYLDVVKRIFKNNENNKEFDENVKLFIYNYLLYFKNTNNDDKSLKKYYWFLVINKITHFDKNTNILSVDNINSLLNNNYYYSAFYLIKNIDKSQLVKINSNLLDKIIDNFTVDKKEEIKEFLEIFPDKVKNIINHFKETNQLKDLLGILKYAKKVEELDDELAQRINQKRYFGIMYGKFKRNFEEKKQYYSIIEFINKSEKYFEIFFPIFEKLAKETKQKIAYRLLYTVIDTAKKNNYNIFPSILRKYKYNKEDLLEFTDYFGPHTEGCLSFTKEQINVLFIDKVEDLKLYGEKYF